MAETRRCEICDGLAELLAENCSRSLKSGRAIASVRKQLEIDTAAADELFANASAMADLNSRVISATSDLLTATIQAAKQVGQAIY